MWGCIYKICERTEWDRAAGTGAYDGSVHDRADGFIHFSTAAQMMETAAKHFAGQKDLVLVAIDADSLNQSALKWEPSRGGDLFPHLYAALPTSAALWVKDLPWSAKDDKHLFPADLKNA